MLNVQFSMYKYFLRTTFNAERRPIEHLALNIENFITLKRYKL